MQTILDGEITSLLVTIPLGIRFHGREWEITFRSASSYYPLFILRSKLRREIRASTAGCASMTFVMLRNRNFWRETCCFTTINHFKMLDFAMKFCQILKKMASTSKNQRWTKGGEADLATRERLVFGAMGPDEKPETSRANR